MTSDRAFRFCRTGGHVAFWLLIVSTLFAGGLTWLVADDGSSSASGSAAFWERGPSVSDFLASDGPVTLTDDQSLSTRVVEPGSASVIASDHLPSDSQPFTLISLLCAAVFVAAAWGETWLLRGQPRRFVTALIPLIVLTILWYATPGARSSVHLDPEVAFIFVIAAIAVREVWFRWAAPTPHTPPTVAPSAESQQ